MSGHSCLSQPFESVQTIMSLSQPYMYYSIIAATDAVVAEPAILVLPRLLQTEKCDINLI